MTFKNSTMYICLCKGVSDRVVRSLVRDGVRTVAEVGRRCGAGTDCGGCRCAIDDVIDEESERATSSRRGAFGVLESQGA